MTSSSRRFLWLAALTFSLVLHGFIIGYLWFATDIFSSAEDSGQSGFESGLGVTLSIGAPEVIEASKPESVIKPVVAEKQPSSEQNEELISSTQSELSLSKSVEPIQDIQLEESSLDPREQGHEVSGEGLAKDVQQGGEQGDQQSYFNDLVKHLSKHKKYSRVAKRRGYEGSATIAFTVDRQGAATAIEIVSSSGHKVIDQSVLDMLERALPLPPVPFDLNQIELRVAIPIEYRLSED